MQYKTTYHVQLAIHWYPRLPAIVLPTSDYQTPGRVDNMITLINSQKVIQLVKAHQCCLCILSQLILLRALGNIFPWFERTSLAAALIDRAI
jgi:hypothetical protein